MAAVFIYTQLQKVGLRYVLATIAFVEVAISKTKKKSRKKKRGKNPEKKRKKENFPKFFFFFRTYVF